MIINGDCLEEMRKMEANSISCIVTDPPYGLHFMGKDWDNFKPDRSKGTVSLPGEKGSRFKIGRLDSVNSAPSFKAGTYDERRNDEFQEFMYQAAVEALRIVKPGGHILMFGAPRRYHRQACALEDAGWEIRDCLMWIFGSGFPKSHNKFGVEGYGTALKPAYEPIIMAMKPCDGTFAQNAEKYGQAGINIDACRIVADDTRNPNSYAMTSKGIKGGEFGSGKMDTVTNKITSGSSCGRWPANVLFDEEAAQVLGEPSRFFYCAKASSSERNRGLESLPLKETGIKNDSGRGFSESDPYAKRLAQNNHPTVKPLNLMEYLIKLVMPPKDGVLLDPFLGSGTTLVAAKNLGFEAIGIEKNVDYCEIAKKRVQNVKQKHEDINLFNFHKFKESYYAAS